ncbi:MAG: SEC-C metal-binding domain-containing protein [Marinoscillum sp.]
MKHVYQLKIELRDSTPKIWRRIQVSEDTTFSDLHDIIQLAMGWEDEHLYEFTVKKVRIYDFGDVIDDGTTLSERDSMDTFLNELVNLVKTKFTYVYDFGDHWEHTIQLEKILPEEKENTIPVCLDGERACPPEDCGGIWRYQDMLSILTDKSHPEYDDITTWIGEDWDPVLFDCNHTSVLLQNYAEQWEEIYEEAGQIAESLEENEVLFDEESEDDTYSYLKKFNCPEDVLLDRYERSGMETWVKAALDEENSIEYQTSERLLNLGFDEKKTQGLILEALSIEWYYDLKYGTDHLEDRYEYNLRHLPETPLELPRLEDTLAVLDSCTKGVPFLAIEALQNDTTAAATSAILDALRNHADHQYCWGDCTLAPFFYALAAEGHLCEELIDPVIGLSEANNRDSDWLSDQGQYLIGKLAQKCPDLTTQKVLEVMEKNVEHNTHPHIFYLFDTFYFCDIDPFKPRLLAFLEHHDLFWYDALTAIIADLQLTEALPILKKRLENLKADPNQVPGYSSIVETEEAIRILEGDLILDPETIKPLCLTREGSWKLNLKQREYLFYRDEEHFEDIPDLSEWSPGTKTNWPQFSSVEPYIKDNTPGRNAPCPCGSGKKYKKCCIGKTI